jgi:hypothetical protein
MGLVRTKLEMLASTWNVDFRLTVGGDIASGVALKILSVDNRDDLNEMKELYEEYFEVPLYEKILVMQERVQFISGIPKGDLTLDWAEEEYIESPTERNQRLQGEIDMNLTNAVDLIKEDNPDLDDEAALRQLIKNIKINRLLRNEKASGGEIMDALRLDFATEGSFEVLVADAESAIAGGGAQGDALGKIPLALQQIALARERAKTAGDTALADQLGAQMEELTKRLGSGV